MIGSSGGEGHARIVAALLGSEARLYPEDAWSRHQQAMASLTAELLPRLAQLLSECQQLIRRSACRPRGKVEAPPKDTERRINKTTEVANDSLNELDVGEGETINQQASWQKLVEEM